MNALLWTIVLALSPFSELRGAIPFGIATGLNPMTVIIASIVANLLLVPILFFLVSKFFEQMFRIPFFNRVLKKTMDRAHRKAGKYVDKYGPIGLVCFVAVPLPVTGGYTGCLAAHLLEIEHKKAIPAVMLGVLIAGIIISLASLGVLSLFT